MRRLFDGGTGQLLILFGVLLTGATFLLVMALDMGVHSVERHLG